MLFNYFLVAVVVVCWTKRIFLALCVVMFIAFPELVGGGAIFKNRAGRLFKKSVPALWKQGDALVIRMNESIE